MAMPKAKSVDNLCIYRIKKGKEAAFRSILKKHWPALRKAGLAANEKPLVWRGEGKDGKIVFIELFRWKDAEAVQSAHATPEVMAVWEPMDALTEGMEFIYVQPERV
jgi:quinol monooxygenase YgiN